MNADLVSGCFLWNGIFWDGWVAGRVVEGEEGREVWVGLG